MPCEWLGTIPVWIPLLSLKVIHLGYAGESYSKKDAFVVSCQCVSFDFGWQPGQGGSRFVHQKSAGIDSSYLMTQTRTRFIENEGCI